MLTVKFGKYLKNLITQLTFYIRRIDEVNDRPFITVKIKMINDCSLGA